MKVRLPSGQLDLLSHEVYRILLAQARSLGYEHLLRAWNYLDGINDGEADEERPFIL